MSAIIQFKICRMGNTRPCRAASFDAIEEKVTLDVAEKGRRDFSLHVGSTEQTERSTSTGYRRSPDDASIGTVIGQQTIKHHFICATGMICCALFGRQQLLRFLTQTSVATTMLTLCTLCKIISFSTASTTTLFSENVQELSSEAAHPSVRHVIAEFNIITNPYSAEYGRARCAVSVNTKSGTNQFHGLAYEYVSVIVYFGSE